MAPLDLTVAESMDGVGTEQIIVALIGGLGLILVALIPVLVTSAKRGTSTTTPSSVTPVEAITPEEAERLWDAIGKLQRDQRDAALWAAEERGRIESRSAEARRDIDSIGQVLGDLRDRFHRHVGAPGHRPRGPDTDA